MMYAAVGFHGNLQAVSAQVNLSSALKNSPLHGGGGGG